MSGPYTVEEREQIIEAVKKWLDSPEAQAKLKAALERANKTNEQMRETMKVDWRMLHKPMTI